MRNLIFILIISVFQLCSCKDASSEKPEASAPTENESKVLEIKGDPASKISSFSTKEVAQKALDIYQKSDRRFEGKYTSVYTISHGKKLAIIVSLSKLPAQHIYEHLPFDSSDYNMDMLRYYSWDEMGVSRHRHSRGNLISAGGRLQMVQSSTFNRSGSVSLDGEVLKLYTPFTPSVTQKEPWLTTINWELSKATGAPYPPDKEFNGYDKENDFLYNDPAFQDLLKQNPEFSAKN
ncbi:hypothetical protein V9K67_21440 [Paraflavisolibacter sp. H34]|uniref:hypothetical protein n=1 Tax=Huijunlia imazamoxiresistens TaxID=3127457 RepID=UPI00301849E6